MASESCKFKYVCRGCGEGWFFPPSTVQCDWCDTPDPFGGDPGKCRPPVVAPRQPATHQPTKEAEKAP